MRKLLKRVGMATAGLLVFGGAAILGARLLYGPLGPIPGPELTGTVVAEPVYDWSFADAIQVIQVETRPADPYTVNTWVTRAGGGIYLFAGTEDKTWIQNILADPRVRIRIDGRIHERSSVRVTSLEEKRAFLLQMRSKYKNHFEFELESWQNQWDNGEFVLFRLDPRRS
jgi:hypothetical protein